MNSSQEIMASGSINNSVTNTVLIAGHKLNGNNYLQWSQSMMIFISSKGKDEYLSGEAVQSKEDRKFKAWKSENNIVMSWVVNSMTEDIGEKFLLY